MLTTATELWLLRDDDRLLDDLDEREDEREERVDADEEDRLDVLDELDLDLRLFFLSLWFDWFS